MSNNEKNCLNVFTYGHRPWHYVGNWWDNICQFFRNLKYAWQRATKGYCNQDIWNLDYYLTVLMRDTINKLADTTHGYPGDDTEEGKTPEAWESYLREISLLLDKSIERDFDGEKYYFNPYTEEYSKYLENIHWETEELPDGRIKLIDNSTPEEIKLSQNYHKEEEKIYKQRVKDRNKALKMIQKRFDSLWD